MKKFLVYTLFFIISVSFSLYQYFSFKGLAFSWDLAVYILNAKWFAGQKLYYETVRPPLFPIILSFFIETPYLFIILSNILFFFSLYTLSKKFKIDPIILIPLFVTAKFLEYSNSRGTELISLSLFNLYLAYFTSPISILIIIGAFLIRYNFIPFLLISGLYFLYKRKFHYLFLFLTLIPWFVHNIELGGHPLFSLIDNYALNIKFRDYMWEYPNIISFLVFFPIQIPLIFYYITKKRDFKKDWLILLSLIIFLISFWNIPRKEERYLFPLLTPLSIIAGKIIPKKLRYLPLFVSIVSIVIIFTIYIHMPNKNIPITCLPTNCTISTNYWPQYIYYCNKPAFPPMKNLPQLIFYENGSFKFLNNTNCIKLKSVKASYLELKVIDIGLKFNFFGLKTWEIKGDGNEMRGINDKILYVEGDNYFWMFGWTCYNSSCSCCHCVESNRLIG